MARLNNLLRVSELQRGRVSFSIDRPWPIMPPLPPVRRSEPQWGQGRCGSFLLEHAKKLKLFRRGYNVATGSRHSRVGLDHSRCHGPPKTQTAGRVLCGKRRGTIFCAQRHARKCGEFSNSIEMPSFEAELIRQIGGRGHVRFGHSYSFAAGYVCILMATLASIRLALAK